MSLQTAQMSPPNKTNPKYSPPLLQKWFKKSGGKSVWQCTLIYIIQLFSVNSFASNPTITFTQQPTQESTHSVTNALQQHPSPYLAMHEQDPVHWQLWSADVLKTAQTQNKLIFISSGYFSCHWCHVMHQESYQNTITATYLNQYFISVKLDRELNPELDKVLTEFSQQATGQAGWPQHVILTPEGYPFAAFIYLNNTDFNQTLHTIINTWSKHPNQIRHLAENFIPPALQPSVTFLSAKKFTSKLLHQLEDQKDDLSGGLTDSHKFPNAPLLLSLLTLQTLPENIKEWLLFTLDQMQSQHLFDHIHGGFYRYTVDPEWQTPHFEKMAYTNALLANVYLQAGERFQRQDYLKTAQQTLSYLQQHLYNPITQLYQSSQSAIDAQNQEGGDYLWSKKRLQKILPPPIFTLVHTAWNLNQAPPYELGWHPAPSPIIPEKQWKTIRTSLQKVANQIPTDSKSILGWNGLILSTYAQAYRTLKQPLYQQKGEALAKRLAGLIQQQTPPRALSKTGKFMQQATLEDYAFIYQGLQDWHLATQKSSPPTKPTFLKTTLNTLKTTIKQTFLTNSGWHYHATPLLPGQQGEWQIKDNAIPSPAALVSCLEPNTLLFTANTLLKNPIDYASYLFPLNQCAPTPPPP